jgi:hypothetical protein
MRQEILRVVKSHAISAQASQYDRRVAVTAIGAVRSSVENIPVEGSAQSYGRKILAAVTSLLEGYNDPEGEYTNGRGIIGSLLGDLAGVVKKGGRR